MSTAKINGKEMEFKYSFNSFKYMQEFDINDFEKMETHPFKLLPILEMLVMGALNSDRKEKVSIEQVQDFIEEFAVEGNLSDLLEELMGKLKDSDFFKSLQKNQ